tara:strand:+ start:1364 stop:2209 length:846 start_codon:yes stop_codon:yes gene_type:complete
MPKKYIPGETKAQRKARKNARKRITHCAEAPQSEARKPVIYDTPDPTQKYFVVCLKWGDKYGPEYVNKLYRMVQRNLSINHEFICYTENPAGLDHGIRVIDLELMQGIEGWWYKPMFFNPSLGLEGVILFLDLDMIIFKNIDKLFSYKPSEFIIIQDFNRHVVRNYDKFNSSIFRLNTGQHAEVFHQYMADRNNISRRFQGDQDWIRHVIKSDYNYWPVDWIQSYKWEMRGKPQMTGGPRGTRDFVTKGEPKILDETCIAVFHGDPNPHFCKDDWVQENWR